jgi:hypothetical protein
MKGWIASDTGPELRTIRIFVCSSGDMIAERQAALRVIEALNRAAHSEARLEPYLWEENTHCFQGARSYQGSIPLPAEFDVFLGFLFSRIGSRLTEEEYRRDILAKLANVCTSRAQDCIATQRNLDRELHAATGTQADRLMAKSKLSPVRGSGQLDRHNGQRAHLRRPRRKNGPNRTRNIQ